MNNGGYIDVLSVSLAMYRKRCTVSFSLFFSFSFLSFVLFALSLRKFAGARRPSVLEEISRTTMVRVVQTSQFRVVVNAQGVQFLHDEEA